VVAKRTLNQIRPRPILISLKLVERRIVGEHSVYGGKSILLSGRHVRGEESAACVSDFYARRCGGRPVPIPTLPAFVTRVLAVGGGNVHE
jgi:hypothetical protein